MSLNFQELKQHAPLDAVATFLGLPLKKEGATFRTGCPVCKTNNPRSIVLTPSKGLWHCFASHIGGDCIALACHVRRLDPRTSSREAAQLLAAHFLPSSAPPQAAATVPTKPEAGVQPATTAGIAGVAGTLIPEHELVQALDLTPEQAKALGIGFRKTGGSLSGRVLIPVRLETGEPVCYVGWHPEKDPPLKFGKINLL